jgi:hypothetical protein
LLIWRKIAVLCSIVPLLHGHVRPRLTSSRVARHCRRSLVSGDRSKGRMHQVLSDEERAQSATIESAVRVKRGPKSIGAASRPARCSMKPVERGPLFCAPLAVCASTIAAVGLASEPYRSRTASMRVSALQRTIPVPQIEIVIARRSCPAGSSVQHAG